VGARLIAVDTETHGKEPWSIQVSICPNTGILVRIDDVEAINELARQVNTLIEQGWELVFHHSMADLDLTEKCGLRTDRFRDTIQESYHACSLPQGLKPLAFRLLGVTMRSWEDVVLPASLDALESWLVEAMMLASTARDLCHRLEM